MRLGAMTNRAKEIFKIRTVRMTETNVCIRGVEHFTGARADIDTKGLDTCTADGRTE